VAFKLHTLKENHKVLYQSEPHALIGGRLKHKWKHIRTKKLTRTFALGFRVDFSEDNEPTEELGDTGGNVGPGIATPVSGVDDAEIPSRS